MSQKKCVIEPEITLTWSARTVFNVMFQSSEYITLNDSHMYIIYCIGHIKNSSFFLAE